MSSRNENGLISGDGDGRPPPEAIVVPGDHDVPAGAISRANIVERLPRRVIDHHAHHRLAAGAGARMRPVQRLGAEQLDGDRAVVRQAHLLQHAACALDDRLAGALRLGRRVDADDGQHAGAAVAVELRGRHLVGGASARRRARRRRARDRHRSWLDAHVAEIAAHVGQQVRRGVADLVQQLLGHAARDARCRRCPAPCSRTKLPSSAHSTIG